MTIELSDQGIELEYMSCQNGVFCLCIFKQPAYRIVIKIKTIFSTFHSVWRKWKQGERRRHFPGAEQ